MVRTIYTGIRNVGIRNHKRKSKKEYGQITIELKELAKYEKVYVIIDSVKKRDLK